MNDRRYLLLSGIAFWLAIVVVLVVDTTLDPVVRWILIAVLAIPAIVQAWLLILDLAIVKGWRAERREKRQLSRQFRVRTFGISAVDSRPDGRLEVWWWLPRTPDGTPWKCSVTLRHRARKATWSDEVARWPQAGIDYPASFAGGIEPVSTKWWHWIEAELEVEGLGSDHKRVWINKDGLVRRSWWAKARSRAEQLVEKGNPPPPYGAG